MSHVSQLHDLGFSLEYIGKQSTEQLAELCKELKHIEAEKGKEKSLTVFEESK